MRATAIRCRSRGAHAPARAAVDASSTAPTRASARGSRLAGNPRFWDEPGQSSSRHHPGWTESRCDSVCLRSRHFVARLRPKLTHHFPPAQGLNPKSEVGNEIEKPGREPIVGRARHSVRAAPATSGRKISLASPSRPATQGGPSRAATPFACGAGTLWHGLARGSRMISRLTPGWRSCPPGGRSRAATPSACGAGTLRHGLARGSRMISRPAQPLRPWPVPEPEKHQKSPKYHFLSL